MLSLLTEYNENELYKCDSLPSSYSVSAEHNCLLENRITNVCLSEMRLTLAVCLISSLE